jgi:hypothetical protein
MFAVSDIPTCRGSCVPDFTCSGKGDCSALGLQQASRRGFQPEADALTLLAAVELWKGAAQPQAVLQALKREAHP